MKDLTGKSQTPPDLRGRLSTLKRNCRKIKFKHTKNNEQSFGCDRYRGRKRIQRTGGNHPGLLWTMVEQGLLPPLLLLSTDAAPVWSLLLSPCCEQCTTRTSLAGKCKPRPNTSQHFAFFREDNSDLGLLPCPLPSPP